MKQTLQTAIILIAICGCEIVNSHRSHKLAAERHEQIAQFSRDTTFAMDQRTADRKRAFIEVNKTLDEMSARIAVLERKTVSGS